MSKKDGHAVALVPSVESSIRMPVTQSDVDALVSQRALFLSFVKSQLVEGVDFGIIPGTPKPSLWKPGAEKLAQLFGIGVRVRLMDKVFDMEKNFAYFTYQAETYVLRNSTLVLTQCEGSCNSQEKKYKERTVYKWNPETRKKEAVSTEATPICDILNTIQKMAQKRAWVGAILQATGASDFFTHDIEDDEDADAIGIRRNADPNPKPAPTVIKANIKATSAASRDQSQSQAAGSTFADFRPEPIVTAPKSIQKLGEEIIQLAFSLGFKGVDVANKAMEIFGKNTIDLNLQECQQLLDSYRREDEARIRGK